MRTGPLNARQLALTVLEDYKRRSVFVHHLLDEHQPEPGARRLATELACGVVRRQATLNALLKPHVRRPRRQVEGSLWTLLQLGAYQLVFASGIPAHAAVHETVELAKWLEQPQWCGFVNGVLRSLERGLLPDIVAAPNRDAVPVAPGRHRKVSQPVFPDPGQDPAGYLSQAFSFPRWLIDRWLTREPFDEILRLGFWFNAPPRMCVRVNVLKTDRDQLLDRFRQADLCPRPGTAPEAVWLDADVSPVELPGLAEGLFSVQDESAMAAARLLAPRPGECVLDLCAAPGTKTAHLAELMQNRGQIVATDTNAGRLELVAQNCRRLGIGIVATQRIAPHGDDLPPGPFDAILVDAPCSNTGVLGKRPEVRWRLQPRELHELAEIQQRLLASALQRLRPGGRIVYSTCSIEPDENPYVVRAILRQTPQLRAVAEIQHSPGAPCDGAYQALLCSASNAVCG